MNGDVLSRIEAARPTMSKGQKRIAGFICDNLEKAAFITAEAMGEQANTSESTVVRFSCALGYKGYPQLQKALQELIKSRLTNIQRMQIARDMSMPQVLSSVLRADIENIRSTLMVDQQGVFNEVIDAVVTARTVYVLGLRSSLPLAQFLAYYFSFLLKDVRLMLPGMMNVMEMLVQGDERDICLGISFPRYSRQTLDALNYAKQRGIHIIGLTDTVDSPLYLLSDKALIARSDMASFADSLVAPMSLINALIVGLSFRCKDEAMERFGVLEGLWQSNQTYVGRQGET